MLVEIEPIVTLFEDILSLLLGQVGHISLPCTGTTVEFSQTVVISSLCLLFLKPHPGFSVAAMFSSSLGLGPSSESGRLPSATCNAPFPDKRHIILPPLRALL